MRVLVLGHPRSGTGYAAHCFTRAGWEVGHERVGRDGIASWMWAVEGVPVPWGDPRAGGLRFDNVLHILREPAACVASIAFAERGSEAWRAQHIDIPPDAAKIERAVWSLNGWNRLISQLTPPTHTAQTEQIEQAVEAITGAPPWEPSDRARNARAHRRVSADEIKATPWVYPETALLWDNITAQYAEAAR
jgi:hypothetical protein